MSFWAASSTVIMSRFGLRCDRVKASGLSGFLGRTVSWAPGARTGAGPFGTTCRPPSGPWLCVPPVLHPAAVSPVTATITAAASQRGSRDPLRGMRGAPSRGEGRARPC